MKRTSSNSNLSFYVRFSKRVLDLVISIILLIMLFIPGLIISFLIKVGSPGPVFFKQFRIGRNSQPFYIYKFRSMTINAPHHETTAEFTNVDQYITKIGYLLRKTSVDELPQLINVFKGEMSIIGPRPLIPQEKINQERHRLGIDQLLPGITGLAQVNGRDLLNDHAKLTYDYQYYQHISFCLDIKIIFKTVTNVLNHKDIRGI